MRLNKSGRKNTIFDIEVVTRSDAHAPIAEKLAAFNAHKKAILDKLHDGYERGPKSEPFDADKSWHDLSRLARFYFWRPKIEQEMTAADRAERLRDLAKTLGQARRMVDRAMQNDVGSDLIKAWFAETNISLASVVLNDDGSSVLTRIDDEIKEVATGLATLETAARKAAHDVRTERGRPKGTSVLPPDYINALEGLYRRSTGSNPGAGGGPFARFVMEFLTALNRRNIQYASVIDAIKDTRARARMRPAASKSEPSPFHNET